MDNCIFCKIIKGDAASWKVMENEYAYAFLAINPVNRYHTLIIPKKHFVNIFDITDNELREVISMVRNVVKLYEDKWGMKDCQIVQSSGKDGQQDVFHIHFHVVPRHAGDGQNIRWNVHREFRAEFEDQLARLK